jgi:hypothetical protein
MTGGLRLIAAMGVLRIRWKKKETKGGKHHWRRSSE